MSNMTEPGSAKGFYIAVIAAGIAILVAAAAILAVGHIKLFEPAKVESQVSPVEIDHSADSAVRTGLRLTLSPQERA